MHPLLEKNLISTKEASELSGYNSDYLARLCKSDRIRGRQIGRTWLVDRTSLEGFIHQQGERKVDRARALARAREYEYRTAQPPVEGVKEPRITRSEHITLLPERLPTLRLARTTGVLAAVLAVLVLGVSAYAAQSNVIPMFAENVMTTLEEVCIGFTPIASAQLVAIQNNFDTARAASANAEATVHASMPRMIAIAPTLTTLEFREPSVALAPLPHLEHASFALAPQGTNNAASNTKPLHLGLFAKNAFFAFIGAPHAIIALEVRTVYAVPDAATYTSHVAFDTVSTLGTTLAVLTARAPGATIALAETAQSSAIALGEGAARAFYGGEYGIAERFVALAGSVETSEMGVLKSSGTLAYESYEGVVALGVPAQESIVAVAKITGAPLASVQNAVLGTLGKGALALGTIFPTSSIVSVATAVAAQTPALTTGQSAALTTYTTLHGLFDSTTKTLSFIFAPLPIIVLPNAPAPVATAKPAATSTRSTSQLVVNGPTYRTYSTTVQGVSQSTLDQSLAALKSDLLTQIGALTAPIAYQGAVNQTSIQQVNMIQSLTDLILHTPVIDGARITSSNFSGGSISATTGNFTTLSAGTSTFSGPVDATGFTINGVPLSGSGTVTSVDASGGTTGLTFTGGPITGSGSLTLAGKLAIANGGTGTSTAPTYGKLLLGNAAGTYDLVATSSLGIIGGASSYTSSYPIQLSGNNFSLAFGTSTANTWGGIQTFTTAPILGALSGLIYGNNGTLAAAATTTFAPSVEFVTTGTLGTLVGGSNSTLSLATNGVGLSKVAQISANSILGNITGALGNVTALATSSLGILLSDTRGTLAIARGGTGTSSAPTYGQLLVGDANGNYELVATSSLGIVSGGGSVTGVTGTYPILSSGGTAPIISLAFGTSSSNTWGGTQTFTSAPILGALSGLIYGNAGTLATAATTSETLGSEFSFSGTSLGARVGGGSGTLTLATNQTALSKLVQVAANTILGNNTGATGNVTAFATSTLGIALSDTTGTLAILRGGTGQTSFTANQVHYGNFATVATSSIASGTNITVTNGSTAYVLGAQPTISLSGTIAYTNGGTGTTTAPISQLLYGGATAYQSVATTTFTPGSEFTTTGTLGALIGGSNSTLALATNQTALSKLVQISANSILGNQTGATGNIVALSTSTLSIGGTAGNVTGIVAIANGGTNATSQTTNGVNYFDGTRITSGTNYNYNGSSVGIGTTSPYASLSISSTVQQAANFPLFAVGSTTNASLFTVLGGGNVGIGTTTPVSLLANTSVNTLDSVGTGSNLASALTWSANGAGYAVSALNTSAASNANGLLVKALGTAATNRVFTANANGADTFIVQGNGNVGIGTTTAGSLLSVGGTGTGWNFYDNATSTKSGIGGINLSQGCFAINGTCAGTSASAITSGTLGIANGGTGTTTAPISQLLYGGGSSYQSVATSSVTNGTGISFTGTAGALVGGGSLTIANTGLLSLQQTGGGTAQTGAITFATSSSATTGLTIGLNITNSVGAFTFAPALSGLLSITNGGTNASSQTSNGVNYFDGSKITSGTGFNYNGTNLGIGSTTPGSLLSIGGTGTGWNFYDNATSTKSGVGGINILQGCFAVNGVCVGGGGAFSNTIANGGTATTTFYGGGVLFYNASLGTLSQASAQTGLFFDNTNQRLGIGTTTPVGALGIQTLTNQASAFSLANAIGSTTLSADTLDTAGNIFSVATTSGADFLDVQATGNIAFGTSVYTSCTGLTTNASGVIQCSVSDQHLKQNITTLDDSAGLSAIRALNPVSFTYIDPSRPQGLQYGVIAQQVQQVLPNLVASSSPTYLTPNGTLTVNYEGLIAPLIRAVQELDVRTASLAVGSSTGPSASSSTPVSPIIISGSNVGINVMPAAARLQIAGNVLADEYDAPLTTATSFTFGSSTLSAVVPANVLTAGGAVDLYKLATYNLSGITLLASAMQADEMRITSLEDRVAALESGAVGAATSTSPFSTSTLASAFNAFGAYLAQGIAQFGTLVADQFVAATNSAGTSSAGSGSVLAGNTTVVITNAYVHASSKIFVTFTSQVAGGWYLSDKQEGSFRLTLPAAATADTSFDYFIVQSVGQIATSTAPVVIPPPPVVVPPPASSGGGTTGTSTPPTASSTPPVAPTTAPPTVTLNGSAAMQINQGDVFTDPGASALDYTGADISGSLTESGSVDASTAGTYTLTYTATDSTGQTGSASRLVNVIAPPPVSPPADSGGDASSTPPGS